MPNRPDDLNIQPQLPVCQVGAKLRLRWWSEHWAIIAALWETCKLCEVDPQVYLCETRTKIITGHLKSQLDDLMLWAFGAGLNQVI